MENRSHAIMAGLFVLILVAATAVTAIWIGKKNVTHEYFELISRQPVGGLSIQSQVRYQGMAVGQVQRLEIDQNDPGSIRIGIGVIPETPVTKGTWAEITTQGVTGISNIDLRDDGSDPQRVHSSEAKPYLIPVRPGFLQRLQNTGAGMVSDVEIILKRASGFLTEENSEAFAQILNSTKTLTASLNQSVVTLEPVLTELPELIASLRESLQTVDRVGEQVGSLAKSAQSTLDLLNSPTGPLGQAATSLKQLERLASQVQASTLPEIQLLIERLGAVATTATRTMRKLENTPQALLLGPAPVAPGPGEPGFEGFGH